MERCLENKDAVTFAEFFAGIGLVRLGLERAGLKCVFSTDIEPKKKEIYCDNFPCRDFLLEDIWKLNKESLPPKFDLATASFPCIDLSVAGYRNGLKGKHSSTFWALIDLLKDMKESRKLPSTIMVENVVGFLTSQKGDDFRKAIASLNSLDYWTDAFVLDAKYFSPQSRPRLFIIGFQPEHAKRNMSKFKQGVLSHGSALMNTQNGCRPKQLVNFMKTHTELNWGILNLPALPPVQNNLQSIIEDLDEKDSRWWPEDKVTKLLGQMSEKHSKAVKNLQTSTSPQYVTIYRRKRKEGSRAEIRQDGLAGCLRTPGGGSSKQILLKASKKGIHVRWLTPREYARLQGVPDNYKISTGDTQAYHGFGDAVCVPAIEWIGKNILSPALQNI